MTIFHRHPPHPLRGGCLERAFMDRQCSINCGQRGMTLVESVVAGSLGLIVAGAIFYFVSFTGDGTNRLRALQQLEQESSIISELFIRNVRNGTYVCANADANPPSADIDNLTSIIIRNTIGVNAATTFAISGNSLLINGSMFTSYLATLQNPSHFKVYQNGKQAELYLSLSKVIGNDTIQYTQTTGRARCKN